MLEMMPSRELTEWAAYIMLEAEEAEDSRKVKQKQDSAMKKARKMAGVK